MTLSPRHAHRCAGRARPGHTLLRGRGAPAVVVATLLLTAFAFVGPAATTAAAAVAGLPADPPASLLPSPDFRNGAVCVGGEFDTSATCQSTTVSAINRARAAEHVKAMTLPSNYAALTPTQQLLVLIDLERVDRGLSPIAGAVDVLDRAAAAAVAAIADPQLPNGYPYTSGGSIMGAGQSTALWVDYEWMYDDGTNSPNPECKAASDPLCWIHRHAILGSYADNPSSIGISATMTTWNGHRIPGYAAILVGDTSGARPAYTFTWAQEQPYLQPLPAVRAISPTSGPAAGGTTVTLSGTGLRQVTSVAFGSAGAGSGLSASADGTSLTVTAPPSANLGTATVTVSGVQGTQSAGSYAFTASAPSPPRSVAAGAVRSGAATVTWTAPVASGGSPITGYLVAMRVGGKALVVVPAPSNATSTSVPGLLDGTAYTFTVVATNLHGASASSQASQVQVPPFASAVAFVTRQYEDVVGRAPTGTELLTAVASLQSGASPGSIVVGLRHSADATSNVDPVTRLYFAYFLRIPDVGGLSYWIGRRRGGTTLSSISSAFATSKEFVGRYGSLSNGQFVGLVYQNVLGRAADAAGLTYWTNQLTKGADTRGQVMIGFSESHEYVTGKAPAVAIAVTWIDLLGTSPAQATFDQWVTALGSGGSSDTDLVATVLASQDYVGRILS